MLRISPLAVAGMLAMASEPTSAGNFPLGGDDQRLLNSYARDTWKSIEALAAVGSLPSDGLWRSADGTGWTSTPYTSPTNIAAYLWSTIAAEGLGLIDHADAGRRLTATLSAVARLDRSNGFFYNWYDPRTGARLRKWPGGGPVRGFLSTVDNAWLAAALMMVGQARPELKATTDLVLAPMNFGFFFDPLDPARPAEHPGLFRGGYFPDGGGRYADFHYGLLNTEPRIASYIAIARGDIPADHYYRMRRSAPEPGSPVQNHRGILVSEGSRPYRGSRVVPSWDGTMFEALMVPLFVPEADWAPESWGINHQVYARAQFDYGLSDAHLGYWGISASSDARGGYHAFGIAPLGLSPTAGICRDGRPPRVITPHASFLALPYMPREAIDNLKGLASRFKVYGEYGFFDAVDVGTGAVSAGVLVLDQGMILASIANALGADSARRAFSAGLIEEKIRPLIRGERFNVGPPSTSRAVQEHPAPRLASVSTVQATSLPPAPTTLIDQATRPLLRRVRIKRPVDSVDIPTLDSADRTDSLGRRTPVRRKGTRGSGRRSIA